MKFGSHYNPKEIQFTLSPWTYAQPNSYTTEKINFYLGSTSWHQPHWSGVLWSVNNRKGQELYDYQTAFNSIEFNSSFYGIPSVLQVQKWKNQIEDDFRFALKVPKQISQAAQPDKVLAYWDDFLSISHQFGNHAGILFWQFPSRLTNENWKSKLYSWIPYIPRDIHLAFEIRNPAAYLTDEFLEWSNWLKDLPVSLVITDTPGVRDIIHNRIISDKLMIRFVSSGDISVDKLRLDQWIAMFQTLEKNILSEIYFFIHDHDTYRFPELVLYLSDKIFTDDRYRGRGPKILQDTERQMSLF